MATKQLDSIGGYLHCHIGWNVVYTSLMPSKYPLRQNQSSVPLHTREPVQTLFLPPLSASMNWTPWTCSLISQTALALLKSNCFLKRSLGNTNRCAPIAGLELSKTFIAIMNPIPHGWWDFPWGFSVLENEFPSCRARIPILFSFFPKVNPSVPFSTWMSRLPRTLWFISHRKHRINIRFTCITLSHCFVPLRI